MTLQARRPSLSGRNQRLILGYLRERRGWATSSEICEATGLDAKTFHDTVPQLVRLELVETMVNPEDARRRLYKRKEWDW